MVSIIFLIISTILGAGFATGAELVAFFGNIGLPPILVSFLVGVFLLAIMTVLIFCARAHNKIFKTAFTVIYFLIFIVLTAGIANLGGVYVTIVVLVLSIAVVMFGFERLLSINKYLILAVVIILLTVSVANFKAYEYAGDIKPFKGVWSAFLYAGMNCCILEAVFSKCLVNNSKRKIMISAIIAIVIICTMIFLILHAIQGVNAAMPILELNKSPIIWLAVFFSIFTSMFVCLYNICVLSGFEQKKYGAKSVFLSLLCLIAFGFSFFGFIETLSIIYRFIGGCMILYVCFLGFKKFFFVNNSVDGLNVIQNQ